MKKIFWLISLIIATGFGISTNAQDIILKNDASEIKAKVLEITDQQIKYKEFDFQDGPIRNISISEVLMITYNNEKREIFEKHTFLPTQQGKSLHSYSNSLKDEFDRIGKDDIKMLNFFKKNNFMKYYNNFDAACKMRNTGKALLGVGLGSTVFGGILMIIGLSDRNYSTAIAGYVFIGAGEVFIIASIPVSAVAGGRKRTIKNNFAREYFGTDGYTFQPTLNLKCTGNGLGIALKF